MESGCGVGVEVGACVEVDDGETVGLGAGVEVAPGISVAVGKRVAAGAGGLPAQATSTVAATRLRRCKFVIQVFVKAKSTLGQRGADEDCLQWLL